MNPGLVVKLRPTGPWRIGPDSGARTHVDFVYHSDALYSAITSAMARMGRMEEWLDATARNGQPAVRFSSCFPFQDEICFIVPPRTVWPPTSPALMAARVRWKSARFVPVGVVQSLLFGQTLDESHWIVDGVSECLVPAGRPGPFRTGVRFSAAVDRLSGAAERHSTACIEFRDGAGLWAVISFASDAAYTQWNEPVRAAFRWLADSGFGGERSRGWGRADAPEFIEGTLPELILPPVQTESEPSAPELAVPELAAENQTEEVTAAEIVERTPGSAAGALAGLFDPAAGPGEPERARGTAPQTGEANGDKGVTPAEASPEPAPETMPDAPAALPDAGPAENADAAAASDAAPPATADIEPPPAAESETPGAEAPEAPGGPQAQWLLSLFTPGSSDSVDWERGDYAMVTRGGRVESPVRWGEPKKQLNMIAEGSVLIAAAELQGAATDVAPEGFPHPVFRAGFALSIPLPREAGA